MRLCVGTAKGIVMLEPGRAGPPRMVLAEPPAVWCMAQDCRDPGVIYAGAVNDSHLGNARGRAALARSTDGGKTWTDITPRPARDEDVWTLAVVPDTPNALFVGTSNARLFYSADRGRTFVERTAFLKVPGRDYWTFPAPPHLPHVRAIAFDPANSARMYVGVEVGGVVRSSDGGMSFELSSRDVYPDVHSLVVDPTNPARVCAATGRGLYISETSGQFWTRLSPPLSRSYAVALWVSGAPGHALYVAAAAGPPTTWGLGAAGADALLFRSTDRARSFSIVATGYGPARGMLMRLVADPATQGAFFGVMNDGTVISGRDGEERATVVAEHLPPAYDLVVLP